MTSPETTTALLFPGQGSHAVGMEEPHRDNPLLARGIELLGFDPFERLADGTRSHQPALFLCSMCQWASPSDYDTPLAAAGHSLGEYAALTAAGAIDFDDAVRLVGARANAMAEAADMQPGGMVAMLKGERDDVYELAAELGLTLANDNAPGQIVLSGAMEAVDEAVEPRRRDRLPRRASSTSAAPFTRRSWRPPPTSSSKRSTRRRSASTAFPVLSNGSTRAVRRHPRGARREPPQAGALARDAARARRRWARRTTSSAAPATC